MKRPSGQEESGGEEIGLLGYRGGHARMWWRKSPPNSLLMIRAKQKENVERIDSAGRPSNSWEIVYLPLEEDEKITRRDEEERSPRPAPRP